MIQEDLERLLVPKKEWEPFKDRMRLHIYIRWGGRRLSPTRSDVNNRGKVIPDFLKKIGFIPDDVMAFFKSVDADSDPPGELGPGIQYSITMPLASWKENTG